jgi:hypothetical protein
MPIVSVDYSTPAATAVRRPIGGSRRRPRLDRVGAESGRPGGAGRPGPAGGRSRRQPPVPEPSALERVAELAVAWFLAHLAAELASKPATS